MYDTIMGGSKFRRSREVDVILEYRTPDHTDDI